jgi:hypothetical protein
LCILGRAFEPLLDGRIGLVEVKALARLEIDALEPRDDRLIGDVGAGAA